MLILGVDGGGSKTVACVASVDENDQIHVLGTGHAGPSNVRAVGLASALQNLDSAVDDALGSAGTGSTCLDVAVLALAGSSLPDVQSQVVDWAHKKQLSHQVDVVHDADAVLAAGVGDGCGIALIVGTGSVAIGVNNEGEKLVSGGWGHWFGDLGSGFDLGRSSLAAVANAVDGVGPNTNLVARILQRLDISDAREIVMSLQQAVDIRREIASLAPVLLECAEAGDTVAADIVTQGAVATASLVKATATKLRIDTRSPLALAGGIACSSKYYRRELTRQLTIAGFEPDPLVVVDEPVQGSLILARERLSSQGKG
jgi:N-acetylglucosamine kinase-like BadF-type ATPase